MQFLKIFVYLHTRPSKSKGECSQQNGKLATNYDSVVCDCRQDSLGY